MKHQKPTRQNIPMTWKQAKEKYKKNVEAATEWYEDAKVEEPIRGLVRHLRNEGFNTSMSCGHEMTIEIETDVDFQLERVKPLVHNYLLMVEERSIGNINYDITAIYRHRFCNSAKPQPTPHFLILIKIYKDSCSICPECAEHKNNGGVCEGIDKMDFTRKPEQPQTWENGCSCRNK